MVKAYSYVRFSTPDQMRGDSFRRQTELAKDYALKHKLELDDKLTFHDIGVSAYRGKNSEAGRLAEFKEAVSKGLVPPGSFLLVESLDRISRQAARRAFRVLEGIVDAGITVVTMSDGKAYDAETLDRDPMSMLMAFLIFIRSNEESATKGRRLKEVWSKKRRVASDGPLTSRGPAWLTLDHARKWKVDREKANVVRRIYRLAASGQGQHQIAETLNKEGVPTFGDASRRPGKHWHRSYVARLLSNPAVVGTMVPHTLDYENGRRVRQAQTPVRGYYPAIIKEDLFEQVKSLALEKRSPRRGRHANAPVQNILGGLGKCPICSGTMTRVTKGSRARAGKPFLVCAKAKVGAGCEYRSVKLDAVETCLRENVGHIVSHVPAPADGTDLQEKLRDVETSIDKTEEIIAKLIDALSRGPSAALRQRLRDTEAGLEALQASEKALWDRVAATHGPLLEARLEAVDAALEAEPFSIAGANLALRQVLSAVVVNYRTGHLELQWLHGGTSEYLFAWPEEPN